jgi:translation initiation factor 3 subunit G
MGRKHSLAITPPAKIPLFPLEKFTSRMEIAKFEPDTKKLLHRSKMQPFGDTSRMKVLEKTGAPAFKLYTTEVGLESNTVPQTQALYKPVLEQEQRSSAYIPPFMRRDEICSVKISNLPLDITKERLYQVLRSQTGINFISVNMIYSRDTGVFRGFAFVVLDSKESATNFMKDARNIVIDSLRLSAELAR